MPDEDAAVRRGFAHCVNIEGLDSAGPMEIIPGYQLARATREQARRLHEILLPLHRGSCVFPWEGKRVTGGEMTGPLPEEEWRYFGINFEGTFHGIHALSKSAELLGTSLFDLGVILLGRGVGYHPVFVVQMAFDPPPPSPVASVAEVGRLSEVHERLSKHDHQVFDLETPLRELQELKLISRTSKLGFLGYFAVLEFALTHAPKPSDPYDSITRQVKTKMALVARRTGFEREYATHFDAPSPDKVWTRLYAYRSAIAHGTPASFTGEQRALRSHENALAFLVKATTCVLRMALTDGALLRDLKEC